MHGPSLAATLAAALWLGLGPEPSPNPPRDDVKATIARARALLAKDDARGAAALLQEALPGAGADLGPMIVVLRQAYTRAADQATKAGRGEEAEEYRENLQILNRRMRGQAEPGVAASTPPTAPRSELPPQRERGPEGRAPAPTRPAADRPDPPRPEPMPAVPGFDEPATPRPIATAGDRRPSAPGSASDPLAIDGPVSRSPSPASQAPSPRDPAVARAASREAVTPAMGAGVSAEDVGGASAPADPPPHAMSAAPKFDRPAPSVAPERPRSAGVTQAAGSEKPVAQTVADPGPKPGPAAAVDKLPDAVPAARSAPAPPQTPGAPTSAEVLKAADTAYLKQMYLDANVLYGKLAKAGQLPEGRKLHWAYCRSAAVLLRLNAGPKTNEEWAAIRREIDEIKAIAPKFWYAEYLHNRAQEMSRGIAKAPKGRVVRGAMPEPEDETSGRGRDSTRALPHTTENPPAGRSRRPGAFAMAIPSTDTPAIVSSRGDSGRWKVKESASFLIFHDDPALADRVADAAEAAREALTRKWTGSPPPRHWAPKCEVYLYPDAAIFSQVTGQPPESPGFSTMESNGVSVTGRRIKLRADAASLVEAVVPHEVTHVLLADLFPARQIPRWADEGISVLSEPATEQDRRVADLDSALNGGRIFTVEALMVSDYPEGKYWPLYYAQSISLTRFLVDQGKPGQLIEFLQGAQRNGVEPELKRVYGFEGYTDLQARWLEYARQSSSARIAARNAESRTR